MGESAVCKKSFIKVSPKAQRQKWYLLVLTCKCLVLAEQLKLCIFTWILKAVRIIETAHTRDSLDKCVQRSQVWNLTKGTTAFFLLLRLNFDGSFRLVHPKKGSNCPSSCPNCSLLPGLLLTCFTRSINFAIDVWHFSHVSSNLIAHRRDWLSARPNKQTIHHGASSEMCILDQKEEFDQVDLDDQFRSVGPMENVALFLCASKITRSDPPRRLEFLWNPSTLPAGPWHPGATAQGC